jgi:hypothetical protein
MLYRLHQRVSSPETIVGAQGRKACCLRNRAEKRKDAWYQESPVTHWNLGIRPL